jgi:hypothetical protein
MLETLKDIESLETVLKLLAPGSMNNPKNKKAVVTILTNMLNYKISELKLFEDTMAPTDFGMSKMEESFLIKNTYGSEYLAKKSTFKDEN